MAHTDCLLPSWPCASCCAKSAKFAGNVALNQLNSQETHRFRAWLRLTIGCGGKWLLPVSQGEPLDSLDTRRVQTFRGGGARSAPSQMPRDRLVDMPCSRDRFTGPPSLRQLMHAELQEGVGKSSLQLPTCRQPPPHFPRHRRNRQKKSRQRRNRQRFPR